MKANIVVGSVLTIILINNVEGKFNLDGLKKMTKPLKAPCIQQSGVDPALIEAANNKNFVEDPQLKCYFMCVLQKLKTIKSGKIAVSALQAQINALVEDSLAVRLLQLTEACKHTTLIADLCEAAYAYIKCGVEYDNSLNFFP
ncbi:general odorant-binding protein 83a-like [Leptopilina boulardi]|uniref:general odorant-binding protein 83a-like n=1 Tax=Leptopilina boulardi TaxID=63433 RepID=UPI0021F54A3F|nr:general odorant-binding protein 83a-like [Leptopilina boulardi]